MKRKNNLQTYLDEFMENDKVDILSLVEIVWKNITMEIDINFCILLTEYGSNHVTLN